MSHFFRRLEERGEVKGKAAADWARRAESIRAGCHEKQRGLIDSALAGYKYLSTRCPRRSGKTYGLSSLALFWGEKFPGSRVLIISLTLKSTVDNYWITAPCGLFHLNETHSLGLKFNKSRFTWEHENGSRGQLAGAETGADIERIRGALAEADVAIVDECKSFAPELLLVLIRDVLLPGLMTRNGVLVLSGTPGSIPVGMFYEATSEKSRTEPTVQYPRGRPTCIPVSPTPEQLEDINQVYTPQEQQVLWRLHTWTIRDNTSSPAAWSRALADKLRAGWPDDHPAWKREYEGEWVTDTQDLVYSWVGYREKCSWLPAKTKTNPAGLPEDLGPWHFVLGIDLGFVDDSALVLAAYSEKAKELRHVYDFKSPGLTVDGLFDEVFDVIDRFGRPDAIVADTAGGGSKMLVETLNQRYGLGVEPAKKTEKQDHIELVNSDFSLGRIKIIPGSDLAHELSGLQWDLSKDSKILLARTGRLREDPACPNHLCDALLYLYRYSYHFWSEHPEQELEVNSVAWFREMEAQAILRARARKSGISADPHNLRAWSTGRPYVPPKRN